MTTERTIERTTRRGRMTGLGKLLAVLGVLLLLAGLLWALLAGVGGQAAQNLAGPVPGTVTGVENGIPTVSYTVGGQSYERTTGAVQNPQPAVGDQVQVRYAESAPDRPLIGDAQQIDAAQRTWWWGLVPAVLGLALLMAGRSLRHRETVETIHERDAIDDRRGTQRVVDDPRDDRVTGRRRDDRVEDGYGNERVVGRRGTDRDGDGYRDDRVDRVEGRSATRLGGGDRSRRDRNRDGVRDDRDGNPLT